MTSDRNFLILREDNDTFRLSFVDADDRDGRPDWRPSWKVLTTADIIAGMHDESLPPAYRRFYLAAAALTSGEKHQRRGIERITATGTRNIKLYVRIVPEYIEETMYPGEAAEHRRERRKDLQDGIIDMEFQNIIQLLREQMTPVKEELGFPVCWNPSQFTYTIPDRAVALTDHADCQSYLRKIQVGRLLTVPQFERVKLRLNRDCPEVADAIVAEIEATASREHLSAVSLTTAKDGQMVVSVVNVRGDLLSMEAWKFLQLVHRHGESLSLGQLDRRGGWLPEPLIRFNDNKVGEVLARYTAEDSVLQAFCRREVATAKGGIKIEPLDRSEFILDQDFLVCLYVTIAQLREQAERFQQLREHAEVKVALNADTLFDQTYFDDED